MASAAVPERVFPSLNDTVNCPTNEQNNDKSDNPISHRIS